MIAGNWQRAEGGLILASAIVYFSLGDSGLPLWLAGLLFFAPDLSLVAYAFGARIGAFLYNACHLYGTGAALMALGFLMDAAGVELCGLLWLAHAGLDRMLGYGLKSPQGFALTHLGPIGKNRSGPGL